jgi:ribosome-binding protein aMBF1 (putative translation factor)
VKILVNWQYLLFTGTWRHSMLASRFCKICGEKHPKAFVKVVEGSEISNFGIHCSVHFSTNFWSKSLSNQPAPQRVALERDVAMRRERVRACCLGVRAISPRS